MKICAAYSDKSDELFFLNEATQYFDKKTPQKFEKP